MALDVKTCNMMIGIMGTITLAVGVVVGYLFHKGENDTMFIPLAIGFVLVFITYFFVEKRALLMAGNNRVEKF